MSTDVRQRIHEQVTTHPVVLYMKGNPKFPQCGFSANAVRILNALGVTDPFTIDVLQDAEIRRFDPAVGAGPAIPDELDRIVRRDYENHTGRILSASPTELIPKGLDGL